MYAKVNKGDVIIYPYTIDNLLEENPYTNYDSRFNVAEWYAQTKEYEESENEVVVVNRKTYSFDQTIEKVVYDTQPSLEDGDWVLNGSIVPRTPEEIANIKNTSPK